MPELKREPTDADLRDAKRPLIQINPQRQAAYKARKRSIENAYDSAQRKLQNSARGLSASDAAAKYAEVDFLEAEKFRKLEQLKDQYKGMLEKTTLEELKAGATYVADASVTRALGYAQEAASRVKDAYEIASHTALIAQVGATGLLMTNPFTAALAVLNLADKWIGRAIGWAQMAKHQWDADCSRVSTRIGKKIAEVYGNSEFHMARTTGSVFAGADQSTIARQRLEKKLYHKIWNIREDVIKYKILTVEMEQKAQVMLEEKNQVARQVVEIDNQVKAFEQTTSRGGVSPAVARQLQPKIAQMKAKCAEQTRKCLEISEKIMAVLNEVNDNNQRLVNDAEVKVTKMCDEIVKSFENTAFQGKLTGSHSHGSWRQAIRRAFS
ncbi:hypothetical protein HY251_10145 [bacterium]|nr:hypothetical protein [bacterium]